MRDKAERSAPDVASHIRATCCLTKTAPWTIFLSQDGHAASGRISPRDACRGWSARRRRPFSPKGAGTPRKAVKRAQTAYTCLRCSPAGPSPRSRHGGPRQSPGASRRSIPLSGKREKGTGDPGPSQRIRAAQRWLKSETVGRNKRSASRHLLQGLPRNGAIKRLRPTALILRLLICPTGCEILETKWQAEKLATICRAILAMD